MGRQSGQNGFFARLHDCTTAGMQEVEQRREQLPREKVRPGTGREAGLGHAGGTSPWMGEGRTMQEQLSRVTQEQLPSRSC